MTDPNVSTVTLPVPVTASAVAPAVTPATPTDKPAKVRHDLGFKADGTPRLRRERGTGSARRIGHPKVVQTYFILKSGQVTTYSTEAAALEFLSACTENEEVMVIRGQELQVSMRAVLAEVK
jgi:hypothetical protein